MKGVILILALAVTTTQAQPTVQAWVQNYNGPENSADQPNAIAVDSNGNVFVTGESLGTSNTFDYDFATIKYSAAGAPVWTNRYNGPAVPAYSWDTANAIAVGINGSVFVTGYSYGSGSGYDYATIAYSDVGSLL